MTPAAANERAPALGRRVVVLACGEPERGDDAVALRAVDGLGLGGGGGVGGGLRGRLGDGRPIDIRRCGALEPEHLLDLGPEEACVVVDCVAGIPPGEVIVRPLRSLLGPDRDPLEDPARQADGGAERTAGGAQRTAGGRGRTAATPRSTHLLPVADVLGLVDVVRPGLPVGSFVGVGGAEFGLGRGLSPAVEAALPTLVDAIEAEVVRLGSTLAWD